MRKIFIDQLTKAAKRNKKIVLIVGDLGYGVVEPFKEKFPKRFFNAGVAEQNMAGLASGLALEGFHVFIYSIANFPTFRCAEQIRNDIDYHNLSVTIVSVGSGLGYAHLGYSHHAIQDYALLRSFPRTNISAPANNQELKGCIKYILKNPGPSYLRLDKSSEINSNRDIPDIKPGKWIFYKRKNQKNIILSTGSVFKTCEEVQKKINYDYATIPMWSMKSKKNQLRMIKKYKKILTFENHLQDGGFGSWLSESTLQKNFQIKTKINSRYIDQKVIGQVGSEKYLNKKYGPK
tara:strand:+ start:2721 stop:3593 length:873 start_codon:yes stop_codon:yes gene_type:complete